LPDDIGRHQLGFLAEGRPQVDFPDVVALGLFLWGEPALLFGHERPDFVNLDVFQGQPAEPGIHERFAPAAELDHHVHDRCPVNAGRSSGAERVALNEVLKHFDLLGAGELVGHGEIPLGWGSR
jgi:hypothetical protein